MIFLEVISTLHVDGSKFVGKFDKFSGIFFEKIELCGVHGVRFCQVCPPMENTEIKAAFCMAIHRHRLYSCPWQCKVMQSTMLA